MKARIFFITTVILLAVVGCSRKGTTTIENDPLFQGFANPPAEARPFVRWWWNGNHISENEIKRQLNVIYAAGLGGVEINPIAMPEAAPDIGTKPVVWLSKEWNDLLALAARETKQRGMIADLIVGSGWPFGGEFLEEDEAIQRIIAHKIPCKGGDRISESFESLYLKAVNALARNYEAAKSRELVFARLVPVNATSPDAVIDITGDSKTNNRVEVVVPQGEFNLVYGILQRSNREVMHGAPGAAGPVMNHYDRKITRAYLDRLKKIEQDTGVSLKELIRALFCDSIELDGSNWTDNFEEIFYEKYGYRLEQWFPFIFYDPYLGYTDETYPAGFADQLKRVRYDYNKLLVEVFLSNFTREFQDFCTENGVLCRYQAYGTPFLMGMMEGNMIADIPESNNWIYSNPQQMTSDEWNWNQGHGYMIWNLYAASGGHLTGRKIISCEAMTNTRGVFKASLDEIKQHDDMNFITGINHSILHGYNYSPPEAGFPGWVRYGEYFSELNTWWPHFPRWVEYNARLSYIFQQTAPVKNVAIIAPEADIWSTKGLVRAPYHTQPWYCYRLWEPLSQAGTSCDYINQNVLINGTRQNGILNYGPMSYKAIILSSLQSFEPQAATALAEYVKSGGKLVVIGEIPQRSLSFTDSEKNDQIVREAFSEMLSRYGDRVFVVDPPENPEKLLEWTTALIKNSGMMTDVNIEHPDKNVFQIRKRNGDRDFFFMVNSHKTKTISLNVEFPTGRKTPWIWNPENGTKYLYPHGKNKNELTIELSPLESLLLVFEPGRTNKAEYLPDDRPGVQLSTVAGPWQVKFEHFNGQVFERTFETLFDFGTSTDPLLNSFAGVVTYSTKFNVPDSSAWIEIGLKNKGVTELLVNGQSKGINWYGRRIFVADNLLPDQANRLEIKYTPVMANYALSLKNDPVAAQWTAGFTPLPMGIEGEVLVYAKK